MTSNPEEDKKRPFPPERVYGHDKYEPVDQFGVGEEIEGLSRRQRLQSACHVDPFLHPELMRGRERVNEEHEEETRVNADVIIAHGPNGIDVRAIVCADARMLWWEDLKIPSRRTVWWSEDFFGKEGQ